jgi:hypothetical protein
MGDAARRTQVLSVKKTTVEGIIFIGPNDQNLYLFLMFGIWMGSQTSMAG